jgi:hypothetical protein
VNRPSRTKFKRQHYEVNNIDDLWQIDLIDLRNLSKYNDGYKYIFVAIDVFSKFLFLEKMKNKTGDESVRAFKLMLKNRSCRNLNSDGGQEFCCKKFRDLCKKHEINFFQNYDDETHAAVAERVIQTLKRKIYKYFYYKNTKRYINVYKKICSAYNKTYHRTIKMRPDQVCDTNIREVYYNIRQNQKNRAIGEMKNILKKHDFVRISVRKGPYSKASRGANFSEEVFRIHQALRHKPVMYKLEDLCGEIIKGKFYSSEITKVIFDLNLIKANKIFRTRKNKGITECLVNPKGWPHKYKIWIKKTQLTS